MNEHAELGRVPPLHPLLAISRDLRRLANRLLWFQHVR
jgi:hypothetical protein